MTKVNNTERAIVKRQLVARTGTDRRRPRFNLPASFVTQVMVDLQYAANQPQYARPVRNIAVDSYKAGAAITKRRAPAGLQIAEAV